ncbi:LysR family transcriptional regulator [Haliea sp. E17]|uniref:LysR family transcriptional regulator n=1 Tax=Haliea sp. E17 TaxID=3401576 RepID=UPI003AAE9B21
MRLDRMDLNLFVVFEAIYRERSVTRVAQLLHLTQPAVSNALGRLRRNFDDQLFVRTPQGMQPTPVADNVIGDVRRALALLQKSTGAGARFEPARSEKQFRLGLNDLGQTLWLPELYRLVAARAPGVTITSFYASREKAVEALKAGDIDLLVDSPQVNARELEQQRLASLRYVVTMRPGHPLAGRKLSLAAYLAAGHVHVSGRPRGRGHADIALHAMGQRRRVPIRVQHYAAARTIAEDSDLLWTVPEVVLAGSGWPMLEPPFTIDPLVLNLYWTRGAQDDPGNRWMRECLVELGGRTGVFGTGAA